MKKHYDKPGRGRKQCSSCKKYVGVRTQLCDCGATFSTGLKTKVKKSKVKTRKKKKAPKKEILREEPEEEKWEKPRWIIYAPSGKPKVTLEGHTRTKVKDWLYKTREIARNESMEFHSSAYKLYIPYFYSILTPEYNKCLKMIDKILEEETSENV